MARFSELASGAPVPQDPLRGDQWSAQEREVFDTRKPMYEPPEEFQIKDSGQRKEFASGLLRDLDDTKIDYDRVFVGPMLDRYAEHLTKGAKKYPDDPDGTPNWTKAKNLEDFIRFRKGAVRHFRQWLKQLDFWQGRRPWDDSMTEDHASAVWFNIDGAEYTKGRMEADGHGGSDSSGEAGSDSSQPTLPGVSL